MSKKTLPRLIYVQFDEKTGDETDEYLLAWKDVTSTVPGRLGVYQLTEEIDRRDTVEIRRKGSRQWFKPSARLRK